MGLLKIIFSFLLITYVNSFSIGGTWSSIVDKVTDVVDDTVDTVGNVINSATSSVTGAFEATNQFFKDAVTSVKNTLTAIETVVDVVIDELNTVPDIFNVTTWEELTKGAKMVIKNIKDSKALEYIELGCDYLLAFAQEWLPSPLDRIKPADIINVGKCINNNVLTAAIDWSKDVATSFVMMGNSLDFTPIFNVDNIEKEFNDTLLCMNNVLKTIKNRDSLIKQKVLDLIPDSMKNYFIMNDMTLTFELSFTSCTLQCGTVSIIFATSVNDEYNVFYSIGTGVETSSIIGASANAAMGIYKSMSDMTGASYEVSFGILDLPLIPDLPEIIIDIKGDNTIFTNAKDAFGGFKFEGDILDLSLGIVSAFSVGFELSNTYSLYTTVNLSLEWNVKDTVYDAYDKLIKTLDSGGFIAKVNVDISSTSRRILTSNNLTLSCPTTSSLAGKIGQLQLGYIQIHDISFGNLQGDNWCNSTDIYSIVNNLCGYESSCNIPLDPNILGKPCSETLQHYLTVIYSCPYNVNVFDIGCYKTKFWDLIDNGYLKDYKVATLDDSWETRTNGIAKCAKVAQDHGYKGFAIYNHGMCVMSNNFLDDGIYKSWGLSESCPNDGLGDATSINVYGFAKTDVAISDLGCFNDSHISHLDKINVETNHWLTQDNHTIRSYAISKCAQIAQEYGYSGFGLYQNGSCWLSNYFKDTIVNPLFNNTGLVSTCGDSRGTDNQFNLYQFPYIATTEQANEKKKLSGGAIAGIVIGVLLFILIIVGIIIFVIKKKSKGQSVPNDHYSDSGVKPYKPPKNSVYPDDNETRSNGNTIGSEGNQVY